MKRIHLPSLLAAAVATVATVLLITEGAPSARAEGVTHLDARGSAQPVIYPAKGQNTRQQDQDRYECHGWAREQSGGYDPTQPVPAPAALPTAQASGGSTSPGSTAAGMAAGAMGGAAVAELTNHNAGHGAAAGALGGAVIQRVKANQSQQKQQAQQQGTQQQALQQQAAARSQQRTTYERALGACMEGRGYTVK